MSIEPSLLVRKNATSAESARSNQRAIWREYGVLNRFEIMQGGGEGITLADKGDSIGRGRELFSGRAVPGATATIRLITQRPAVAPELRTRRDNTGKPSGSTPC